MKRLIVPLVPLLAFVLTSVGAQAEELLPENLLISRAEPSVFKVRVIGDAEVTVPRHLRLVRGSNTRTLLENEYARDERDGVIAAGARKSDYCWTKIAENPEKYVSAGNEQTTTVYRDIPYATGTAFAVSRDGVFLTNAHVVDDQSSPREDILLPFIGAAITQLSPELGGVPPDSLLPPLFNSLGMWVMARSRMSTKFKEAQIVLKFDYDPEDNLHLAKLLLDTTPGVDHFRRLFPLEKMLWTAPVDILAAGQTFPGEDVAVLKIRGGTEEWKRQIISLPLGDSAEVVNGTPVWAMGFPGAGFSRGAMQAEAEFRVSNHPGHVGQSKLIRGGWEAFEMSADINSGDSGGPVMDRRGRVIALNVASPAGGESGLSLAVPINLARKYLRQAGITPDPGPITALWEEGLRLYARGNYPEAKERFVKIRNLQWPAPPNPYLRPPSAHEAPSPLLSRNQPFPKDVPLRARDYTRRGQSPRNPYVSTANPYVMAMITRCDSMVEKPTPAAEGTERRP